MSKKITVDNAVKHPISRYLYMQFAEPLSNADSSIDAAWDYLRNRWQPKTVDILKELAPPMIRGGGCFASHYHWYEAVGPREKRVPVHNLCWDGLFSNQVGTCELVDLEPYYDEICTEVQIFNIKKLLYILCRLTL